MFALAWLIPLYERRGLTDLMKDEKLPAPGLEDPRDRWIFGQVAEVTRLERRGVSGGRKPRPSVALSLRALMGRWHNSPCEEAAVGGSTR